jgi:hypothetical protein
LPSEAIVCGRNGVSQSWDGAGQRGAGAGVNTVGRSSANRPPGETDDFFRSAGAFGYAVYGHTDSRASDEYNMRLSDRRARSVADVARAMGAMVDREIGFGERQPIASNATAAGMQKNRRVEVVCYRW